MKKIIWLTALVLILSLFVVGGNFLPPTLGTACPPYTIDRYFPKMVGDVDKDGEVTKNDAYVIISGVKGINIKNCCPINCGDVNGDHKVNYKDANIILKYASGLQVPYPIGEIDACSIWIKPVRGCCVDSTN